MKTLKLFVLLLFNIANECHLEQFKNHMEKYWSVYSTAIISTLIAIRYKNLNRVYTTTCSRLTSIEADIGKIKEEIFKKENFLKTSAQNFNKTAFLFARKLCKMQLTNQEIRKILERLVNESSGNNKLLAQRFANRTENFISKIEILQQSPPPGC